MTLGRLFRDTVSKFGNRTAFKTVGKDAIAWTYLEVSEKVNGYAGALLRLGAQRGDRVVILSENSPEWAVFDWACQSLGIVVVPIYPTLPSDQAQYIVKDCGAKLALVSNQEQRQKLASMADLQIVQLRGEDSLDELSKSSAMGVDDLNREIDASQPEDPCTIIYTSGTTGVPKGAVMPQRAFVHVCNAVRNHLPITEKDVFLSFLPMCHVFERVAGQIMPVSLGSTIVYSRSLMALANEIREAKPQIVMTVPRFLENMREKILDKSEKSSPIQQKLFNLMLSQGTRKAKGQFAPLAGILDAIVGKKVREALGGELRFFVSGGAALAPAVAEFYMAIGVTVLQGYGLTETSAGTCVNRPDDNKYWTVGVPLEMELKIADDGEILFRGPGIMLGYYNMPEETAKAIDPDGWFHTGDIGEMEGDKLKITDRKKDILVLGNGKNIAPQGIENKLKTSKFIQEVVVLGDGMDYCVALVVPNADAVRKELQLPDAEKLSESTSAKALIKKEIDQVNQGLANFERVKKHAILDKMFTVDSGELTPTFKVKRKVVKENYAPIIAELM